MFIDEPTIIFAEDDPPTPEQIAAIRDGSRTPDDTPLANVMLELRNGQTGAPILIGDALPGSYCGPGDGSDSRRDRCQWLLPFRRACDAGLYAVVEVQPEGVIDNVDTPGTLAALR